MIAEEIGTARLERMAEMLKAIAHPLRMAIVGLLRDGCELTVTQIYENIQIEQATASQHLAVMKNKGVLQARREGKHTHYSLKYPQLANVIQMVEDCQDC